MGLAQSLSLEEIDLSDDAFWAVPIEERDGAFKTLRDQEGFAHFEEPDISGYEQYISKGNGYYAVVRYADVAACSRKPDVFSSAKGIAGAIDQPEAFNEFFGSMIAMDDPRHFRLRRLASAAFTPRMMQRLESQIREAAARIVDEMAVLGECDFVTEVAARLPLTIICDMMGIPPSESDTVLRCSNVILGAGDPEYVPEHGNIAEAILGAGAEVAQLMQQLAEQRRQQPTEDLTSAMVHGTIEGEQLTDAEIASFFILLLVAGNETTRNAISGGLEQLTLRPDERTRWMADYDSVAPTAVEEIVRWTSPVNHMRRTATRDAELNGFPVRAGDKFLMFYRSANRDESVFADPYRFDLERSPNEHVGIGAPGPHFCLGAHLARREITEIFRQLFQRLPDIETIDEPKRLQSNFINGIKHLPCRFTPASAG